MRIFKLPNDNICGVVECSIHKCVFFYTIIYLWCVYFIGNNEMESSMMEVMTIRIYYINKYINGMHTALHLFAIEF